MKALLIILSLAVSLILAGCSGDPYLSKKRKCTMSNGYNVLCTPPLGKDIWLIDLFGQSRSDIIRILGPDHSKGMDLTARIQGVEIYRGGSYLVFYGKKGDAAMLVFHPEDVPFTPESALEFLGLSESDIGMPTIVDANQFAWEDVPGFKYIVAVAQPNKPDKTLFITVCNEESLEMLISQQSKIIH